jgi:hypothetical protein
MSSPTRGDKQATISVRLIESNDLDAIAESLSEVVTVERRPYFILEAAAGPSEVVEIVITLVPLSIPILKEVGRVVFDRILVKAIDIFSKTPGKEHVFKQEFKVDRKRGVIEGSLSMSSSNIDLMKKSLTAGRDQYNRALDLMEVEVEPEDHYIIYGIELDEASASFKVRRKDVTMGKLTEYNDTEEKGKESS